MENYKFFKAPCTSDELNIFINNINNTFKLDICGKYMLKDVQQNMLQNNINANIDNLVKENIELEIKLDIFKKHISKFFTKNDDTNYVSINKLDKE
jgi:DNA mismatch repair protein MutS